MKAADRETAERHLAVWEEFRRQPKVSPWAGRLSLPAEVTAMVGFVIPVEGEPVRCALTDALARLNASGCLLPYPRDYWHITIVPPALLAEDERPAPSPPGHAPLPHMSLAQYARGDRLEGLAALLEAERETPFGSFHVERLEMFVLPVHDGAPGPVEKHAIPLGRP